jgi:hypothetical protein
MLVSCGHSPTAPTGLLMVQVLADGTEPAPGKTIEIVGTALRQVTNENGLALFRVPGGRHVVRAYDLGTPGPGRPYVEQAAEVVPAGTVRVEFNDCVHCR